MAEFVKFTTYDSTEWIVDFATGLDSEPREDLEAVAQDIRLALSTERYRFPIMGNNFGVILEDLIGEDFNYTRGEVVRRVKDALSIDDRVTGIDAFQFNRTPDGDGLEVSFVVSTTLGEFRASTMIIA